MLLHSEKNLINKYKDFISNNNELILFSPYIKLNALEEMLDNNKAKVDSIITSWKPMDISIGVTDIEVYEFCTQNNIKLLINNQIHLKCIVNYTFDSCTISSSNFTNRGLALGTKYNLELGTIVDHLDINDKCYFDQIIDGSILVDDNYYNNIKKQIEELPAVVNNIPEQFEELVEFKDFFLTSELPYFDKPESLFDVLTNQSNYSQEVIRCVFHDVRLYNLDNSISKADLKNKLKENFLKDPFIYEFLRFNGSGRYFGDLTSWIHNKIKEVPAPTRKLIKTCQQRIYAYIDYLLREEYLIEVPGKHSQFLREIGNKYGQQ